MCTYGINRVLAALPEDKLCHLSLQFPQDEGERDMQDTLSESPVVGENAQMSLARFTNLERIGVYECGPEDFKLLRAILCSWKATKASSRHLHVSFPWESMQSVLLPGEETGSLGQNVPALDESCSSTFFLSINSAHLVWSTANLHTIMQVIHL